MGNKLTIDALIEGGRATAGPPLGPVLGPLGMDVSKIIAKINEKTKAFEGLKLPIKVIVDKDNKEFEIEVGTPPVSALIKKEAGIEKGAKDKTASAGNITLEQALKIAGGKETLGRTMKERVKEIIGTCVSMGITVEGKSAKDALKDLNEGKYDSKIGS